MKLLYQLIILIGLVVILTGFSACVSPLKGVPDENSFFGHYNYDIRIHPYAPVSNLTVYLPLPIQNGIPKIGTLLLTPETFRNESYTFGPLPSKSNFRFAIEEVNGIPFLKITADAMDSKQEYHFDDYESIHTPAYTYLINTRYPLGNESIFQPKSNLSNYNRIPAELNYTTVVYAVYTMEGSGEFYISTGLSDSNNWALTSNAWISNSYTDDIQLKLYHVASGWQMVKGTMTVGTGNYLD
jgi:hypothetical protein